MALSKGGIYKIKVLRVYTGGYTAPLDELWLTFLHQFQVHIYRFI